MKHLFSIVLFLTVCMMAGAQSQQTNLPTFYITTENNATINSTTTYVPGFLTVVSSDTTETFIEDSIKIRGRGNSTWGFAKKPYRIKFEHKRKLLNLPAKAKDWVLLANHADKTLIRNAVAFEIGEFLDMDFTPAVRFVDVVLNGTFLGNYMVTDQVEVGGDRVEVEKQDTTDTTEPTITGGYLLEIDGFAERELTWFTSGKSVKITIKYPDDEDINIQQLDYIKGFTNSFENTLFSETFADPALGYRAMVDTASFIDWYIASELSGNPDCFWSTYIYKKRNDKKFYYGPLWDYDIAFNNDYRLGDALEKRMLADAFQNKTWILRQWMDAWLINKVNQRWKEVLNQGIVSHLQHYVDSMTVQLEASRERNFERWPVLNTRVYNEQFLFPTYAEGLTFLKNYITDRADFLTSSFADDVPVLPGQPFVAEDFYYMVVNKQVRNVIDVKYQSDAINAQLVLWGAVEGRLTQQWKIVPVSDSMFQFVNRFSGLAMKGAGRARNFIQVEPDTSSTEQLWRLIPESTGTAYRIDNVNSGFTADCSGGSSANGTAVIEYEIKSTGVDNQYWYLQKVEKIESGLGRKEGIPTAIMYPNPVQDLLYVSMEGGFDNGTLLEVVSSFGRTLIRQRADGFDARIDVANLPEGMYLLKIITGSVQYTRKFIKK